MPIHRALKNKLKNYSDTQVKVREATSNDPWGPDDRLLIELSTLTYNHIAFAEIMQILWKRLGETGRTWRHVDKSLRVLDYLVKFGSEKVCIQCKSNLPVIEKLIHFNYPEAAKEQGDQAIREKARLLVTLLEDENRLQNERTKAVKSREKMKQSITDSVVYAEAAKMRNDSGGGEKARNRLSTLSGSSHDSAGGVSGTVDKKRLSSDLENALPSNENEAELQLQLALQLSKEEYETSIREIRKEQGALQSIIEKSTESDPLTNRDSAAEIRLSAVRDSAAPLFDSSFSTGKFPENGFDDGSANAAFTPTTHRSFFDQSQSIPIQQPPLWSTEKVDPFDTSWTDPSSPRNRMNILTASSAATLPASLARGSPQQTPESKPKDIDRIFDTRFWQDPIVWPSLEVSLNNTERQSAESHSESHGLSSQSTTTVPSASSQERLQIVESRHSGEAPSTTNNTSKPDANVVYITGIPTDESSCDPVLDSESHRPKTVERVASAGSFEHLRSDDDDDTKVPGESSCANKESSVANVDPWLQKAKTQGQPGFSLSRQTEWACFDSEQETMTSRDTNSTDDAIPTRVSDTPPVLPAATVVDKQSVTSDSSLQLSNLSNDRRSDTSQDSTKPLTVSRNGQQIMIKLPSLKEKIRKSKLSGHVSKPEPLSLSLQRSSFNEWEKDFEVESPNAGSVKSPVTGTKMFELDPSRFQVAAPASGSTTEARKNHTDFDPWSSSSTAEASKADTDSAVETPQEFVKECEWTEVAEPDSVSETKAPTADEKESATGRSLETDPSLTSIRSEQNTSPWEQSVANAAAPSLKPPNVSSLSAQSKEVTVSSSAGGQSVEESPWDSVPWFSASTGVTTTDDLNSAVFGDISSDPWGGEDPFAAEYVPCELEEDNAEFVADDISAQDGGHVPAQSDPLSDIEKLRVDPAVVAEFDSIAATFGEPDFPACPLAPPEDLFDTEIEVKSVPATDAFKNTNKIEILFPEPLPVLKEDSTLIDHDAHDRAIVHVADNTMPSFLGSVSDFHEKTNDSNSSNDLETTGSSSIRSNIESKESDLFAYPISEPKASTDYSPKIKIHTDDKPRSHSSIGNPRPGFKAVEAASLTSSHRPSETGKSRSAANFIEPKFAGLVDLENLFSVKRPASVSFDSFQWSTKSVSFSHEMVSEVAKLAATESETSIGPPDSPPSPTLPTLPPPPPPTLSGLSPGVSRKNHPQPPPPPPPRPSTQSTSSLSTAFASEINRSSTSSPDQPPPIPPRRSPAGSISSSSLRGHSLSVTTDSSRV